MRVIPVYTPVFTDGDAARVAGAVRDGNVSSATPIAAEFEARWAALCDMRYGVSVANGTAALELAVRALGIGPGDEVLCPSFTIISCGRAIVASGATPVLVDADPDTYCLDVAKCAERVGPRTRAILGVHLYGHPYDHEALAALARKHDLSVIEDAAQAHGARVRSGSASVPCGGLGTVSTFSFYANKPITTGEGGMVLARDSAVATRVRELSNLAFLPGRRFVHEELAPNYRLSSVQAALGLSQTERLGAIIATKRRIAALYRERLAGVDEFVLQPAAPWAEPIYWMVAGVLADSARSNGAELARALSARGVETRPFFVGMHEQPALRALGYFEGERYPVTERLARRGLYLPSGLDLDEQTIDEVVVALKGALSEARSAVAVPAAPSLDVVDADSTPFGPLYAHAYDALYAEKDYAEEARTLKDCFERFATRKVKRVLDLGCGTGKHASELVRLGYDVTGVDRSASMLALARERLGDGVRLVESDVRTVDLGEHFDAVALLFAVLGYQTTPAAVVETLRAARRALEPGGVLVFDVWYGPAVLRSPPGTREKRVKHANGEWVRVARAAHDPHEQRVDVIYELSRTNGGVTDHVRETHPMHYFFPHELELALRAAGFRLVRLGTFSGADRAPRLDDYTALVVAIAE